MIDIGLSKMALIGVVALIVIGPEKLPMVARTVGTLLGKAQRYVSDVKAEVSRSMELDELKKMRENMEGAARDVEQSIHTGAADFERQWADQGATSSDSSASSSSDSSVTTTSYPEYRHPNKNWRVKQGCDAGLVQGARRRAAPRAVGRSAGRPPPAGWPEAVTASVSSGR